MSFEISKSLFPTFSILNFPFSIDYVCIDARNSEFFLVLDKRSMTTSICSTGDSGLRTRRITHIRLRFSLSMSNSSLRVPER